MNLINMGFKKRYLNREKILNVYNQGLPKLISLIENNECLIFEDDFSEEVSDIILNYDYSIQEKLAVLIDGH
jgi:hypothetical protein